MVLEAVNGFSVIIIIIREYGSTLYVGLARAVSPTNTNFRTETSNRMLTKIVSIGSYSPEVRTFGTLITSTKVFSLL